MVDEFSWNYSNLALKQARDPLISLGLFLCAAMILRRREAAVLLCAIYIVMVAACLLFMAHHAYNIPLSSYWHWVEQGNGVRTSLIAGFEGPNSFAAAIAIVLPLGLYYACNVARHLTRLVVVITLVILVGGMVATGSRGGLLAAMLCALVFTIVYLQQRGVRRIRIAAVLVVFISVGFAIESHIASNSVVRLQSTDWERLESDRSTLGRYDLAVTAVDQIARDPLIGIGFGGYMRSSVSRYSSAEHYTSTPHNSLLHIGVQAGFVGLVLLLFLYVWCYRRLVRPARRVIGAGNGGLPWVPMCYSLWVAWLSVDMFFPYTFTHDVGAIMWMIGGGVAVINKSAVTRVTSDVSVQQM